MLSQTEKSKLKAFLISKAEFITVGPSKDNRGNYLMSFNEYNEGVTFPSILMCNLLETSFTNFDTEIYQKNTSDIPCEDAVILYLRKKVDFLDLLIFCAVHGVDMYTVNFSFEDMHLYTYDEARGIPYKYCDEKRISISLGHSLEHDIKELSNVARGAIWHLTESRVYCKCHPDPMHSRTDEFWTESGTYWESVARNYFNAKHKPQYWESANGSYKTRRAKN